MPNHKFQSLAEKFYQEMDLYFPTLANYLGMYENAHLLESFSLENLNKLIKFFKEYEEEFNQFNLEEFLSLEKIEYAWIKIELKTWKRFLEITKDWQKDPSFYPEWGVNSIYILTARDFASLEVKTPKIISRLNQISRILKEGKENLENPPLVYTQTAQEITEGGIKLIEELVPELIKNTPSLKEEILSSSQSAKLALEDYQKYLENLIPYSKGDFACGEKVYDEILKEEYLLPYNHKDLWELGKEIFKKSLKEQEDCGKLINPHKTRKEILAQVKTHHPSKEKLIQAYKEALNETREFILKEELAEIPEGEKIEIVETPIFERPTIPYAAYLPPGAFEKKIKGQFWVTPIDENKSEDLQKEQLEEHPYGMIKNIALHEAYPGHHLQLVYVNFLSSNILKRAFSSLFAEGWAFYCEQLMKEYGFFDKFGEFCQLQDQLWRAARIIVDVGLHTGKMSFEEAVKFMVDEVGLSFEGSRAEVRRYTHTPVQPSTYFLGKLEILKIKKEYQDKLKDKFNLKEFHTELLSCGDIPPALIRYKLGLTSQILNFVKT